MRLRSHFSHAPQKAISRKAVIEYRRQECGVGLSDSLKHGGNTYDGVDEDIPQTHDAQISQTISRSRMVVIPSLGGLDWEVARCRGTTSIWPTLIV